MTGGEPLLQDETPSLSQKFLDDGYTVMLETNGSLDIGEIDGRCIKIVDVKCPSSGEQENNLFSEYTNDPGLVGGLSFGVYSA